MVSCAIGRAIKRIERNHPVLPDIAHLLDETVAGLRCIGKDRQKLVAAVMVAQHRNDREGQVAQRRVQPLVRRHIAMMCQVPQKDQRCCIRMGRSGVIQHGVEARQRVKPDDGFTLGADMRVTDEKEFPDRFSPVTRLFQLDQQILGVNLPARLHMHGLDHRIAFGVDTGFHLHRFNR